MLRDRPTGQALVRQGMKLPGPAGELNSVFHQTRSMLAFRKLIYFLDSYVRANMRCGADIQFSAQTLSAAVKSIEDHGYILDLGLPDVSGFLSFEDANK